jgi:PD-(D/E)XK nuclease family transposase
VIPVFADPKTDFVFKRIFGTVERKPLLIALLNHLLELEGEHLILDVEHLSLEQHVAVPELKLSIVDVKCTEARGALSVAHQEGKEEGVAEGKRGALLLLLARAGIGLAEDDRARIQACSAPATLDRWLSHVLGAKTAADVFS